MKNLYEKGSIEIACEELKIKINYDISTKTIKRLFLLLNKLTSIKNLWQ